MTGGESKGVVAFVRRLGDSAVFVAANLHNEPVEFSAGSMCPTAGAKPFLAESGELGPEGSCRLGQYGFVVVPVRL